MSKQKPPIEPGSVAIYTYDGIYVCNHGSAPVFDTQMQNFWDMAWKKVEEIRAQKQRAEVSSLGEQARD